MVRTRISSAQFFMAMFVSHILVTIALNAQYTGGESILDNIISCLLAMALGALIALPVWLCMGRDSVPMGRGSVPELAVGSMGKLGYIVPIGYWLYFLLAGGSSLALFQIFLMDTVNPGFSAGLVTAAITGVALYGALRGIETVARCASCVLIVLLLGCGLVFGIVAVRFDAGNLEPLFQYGYSQTARGTALFLARTSLFADMGVLLPQVAGKKGRGFMGWMIGTAAFVSLTILLISGCLGRYAYAQNFPVYVLASLTEVRSLQRLDAVFTGVWMMCLIIKLAVDMYACRVCFFSMTGEREKKWPVWVTAVLLLLLALLAVGNSGVQVLLLDPWALCLCTVITGAGLPLLTWAAALVRGKGAGK